MSDRETSLQALNDCHTFPGPFTFRVIGENSASFVARVVQAVVFVLGPRVYPQVNTRQSAKGNHQSVMMVVHLASAEKVLEVYAALKEVAGVRMLL